MVLGFLFYIFVEERKYNLIKKVMEEKEFKMFCLVLSQLDGVNKGKESSRAILKYAYNKKNESDFKKYMEDEDIPVLIFEGGTHNDLMDVISQFIENQFTDYSYVVSPDLNNCVTSICFLANNQVWDTVNYLSYESWRIKNNIPIMVINTYPPIVKEDPDAYNKWVEYMGGKINVLLRKIMEYKMQAK